MIGSVNTILGSIYGKAFTKNPRRQNVNAIAFAGTVLGVSLSFETCIGHHQPVHIDVL